MCRQQYPSSSRVAQRSKALHLSARGIITDALVRIKVLPQRDWGWLV